MCRRKLFARERRSPKSPPSNPFTSCSDPLPQSSDLVVHKILRGQCPQRVCFPYKTTVFFPICKKDEKNLRKTLSGETGISKRTLWEGRLGGWLDGNVSNVMWSCVCICSLKSPTKTNFIKDYCIIICEIKWFYFSIAITDAEEFVNCHCFTFNGF